MTSPPGLSKTAGIPRTRVLLGGTTTGWGVRLHPPAPTHTRVAPLQTPICAGDTLTPSLSFNSSYQRINLFLLLFSSCTGNSFILHDSCLAFALHSTLGCKLSEVRGHPYVPHLPGLPPSPTPHRPPSKLPVWKGGSFNAETTQRR